MAADGACPVTDCAPLPAPAPWAAWTMGLLVVLGVFCAAMGLRTLDPAPWWLARWRRRKAERDSYGYEVGLYELLEGAFE